MIGLITPGMKQTGKRSAGKPHAAFDVAGAGNVTMVAGLRSLAKATELPPAPTVRAPALDPTCERLGVKFPGATRPGRTDSCVAMECARARRRDAGRLMSRCADVARATAGGGLAGHRGVVRPWGAVKVTIFDLTCVGTRWRLKKHDWCHGQLPVGCFLSIPDTVFNSSFRLPAMPATPSPRRASRRPGWAGTP